MTKLFNNKVVFVTVLVCAVPTFAQADQHIVRLDMKDATSSNGPPESLDVYVEVATIQPGVEQGIVFTLNIENNSGQVIRTLDPVDMTNVMLFSSSLGGKVSLDNTKPDYMTCKISSFSDQQLKEMHDEKMARRPFLALHSEIALRARHLKTVSDIVPHKLDRNIEHNVVPKSKKDRFQAMTEGKLTLEPGEHFQALLQITRIISNPNKPETTINQKTKAITSWSSRPPQIPHIIDIIPGTYSLLVSHILITDLEGEHSWATSSDRITIQLGEPNNQGQ